MLAALGQHDAERARGDFGVLEEQLVEIAHPVEQQQAGIGGLDLKVLFHHRRDARRRLRGRVAVSGGTGMDCWIVIGGANYKISAARSYRFAAAMQVFHPLRGRQWHDRLLRERTAGQRGRQLTCRTRAPKTRHQFRPVSAEIAAFRERSMRDVFVCDAVRTPIGRFGGSLAKVRADDLAAAPIKALMAQHPKLDWAAGRRGLSSAAPTRPARTTATSRAWRCCWRACRTSVPGADPQSPLRLGPRCGRRRRPRDPRRRDRFRDRRRRRIDDARAVRDGQGAGSVFALGRHLRHHHRLALHQSADEGAIRRRCDAGDRRERRRGIPGVARRPGRVRDPLAAARRQGDRVGLFRRGDHRRSRCPAARPDRSRVDKDEHPRPETTLEGLAKAEADRAQSRHRDGRQCVRRQ